MLEILRILIWKLKPYSINKYYSKVIKQKTKKNNNINNQWKLINILSGEREKLVDFFYLQKNCSFEKIWKKNGSVISCLDKINLWVEKQQCGILIKGFTSLEKRFNT